MILAIQFICRARLRALAAAWTVGLSALAGGGGAQAQEPADTGTQPYLLEANFYEICDHPDTAAAPVLPSEWTVYPPPGGSDTQVRCGPGGLQVSNAGGSAFMYNVSLFKDRSHPLTHGRYLLSGAGAHSGLLLRNGFGDFSDAARTRMLNLHASTPIVNMVEVDWDDRTDSGWYGLLELWTQGTQWLRLEKMPATPIAPRRYAVPGSEGSTWTLASGTAHVAEAAGVRLVPMAPEPARIEQTITLPPGRYEVITATRGDVDLRLRTGPSAAHRFSLVEEAGRSAINSTEVPVTARFTATGQPVTLSLAAAQAGQDVVVFPVEIRPVVEITPTPAQLAAARPSPWPARGATVSNVFDLLPDTRPPRDVNGVACARQVKPWSSNPAWSHHADFADLKSLGANLVRLGVPVLQRALQQGCMLVAPGDLQADGRIKPEVFWTQAWPVILDETEAVVRAAGQAGLKVVVLMGAGTPSADLNEAPDGWAHLGARKEFVRGFGELAARLAPLREHVWAYELMNEPYQFFPGRGNIQPSQWRDLATDTIAAIRAAERKADALREPSWVVFAPVLQPTAYWPAHYAKFKPLPDDHVLYTEHYYDDFAFTHQDICQPGYPVGRLAYASDAQAVRTALAPLQAFSQASGAPVYIGEFGAAAWAGWSPSAEGPWQPRTDAADQPIHDNARWLRDVMDGMEAHGFAWTHHSYRTYYAWNPEVIPTHGPCGPFDYQLRGQPDTPAMQALREFLQRNH